MRVSVFIIAVLCVSRMIAVVSPLSKPHRNVPVFLITVYALLMTAQSSVPFWFGSSYVYDRAGVTCYDQNEYGPVHYFFVGFLEFMTPLFLVCPACGVSIVSLYKSKRRVKRFTTPNANIYATPRFSRKNNATFTMILLTFAYIIFNAPLVLYTLFGFLKEATGTELFEQFLNAFHGAKIEENGHFHLLNFTFTVSVCLNSTANAILFVLRSAAIKSWLRSAGTKTWSTGRALKSKRVV